MASKEKGVPVPRKKKGQRTDIDSAKKRKKKKHDQECEDSTLGKEHARWRLLKDNLKCKSDEQLATMLLDSWFETSKKDTNTGSSEEHPDAQPDNETSEPLSHIPDAGGNVLNVKKRKRLQTAQSSAKKNMNVKKRKKSKMAETGDSIRKKNMNVKKKKSSKMAVSSTKQHLTKTEDSIRRRMRMLNVKKRNYPEMALSSAYQHFTETGDSIRKSAKMFCVPESTLRARVHNPNLLHARLGHATFFTKDEETLLADHCKIMSRMGYGYTRALVMQMANSMAEATGKTSRPKKDWYYGFVKRFPELFITKPKKREVKILGTNEININNYFSELEIMLNKFDLKDKPAQIWITDETGFTLDVNPPKILSAKGDKPFNREATSSVIATGNAQGQVLPPYVIYKGQRLNKEITSGCLPNTKFAVTQNGWSTALTFQDFIQHHFIPNVTEKPCLLLYDGHSTQVTVSLIELARKSDVHMFVLPPNFSHLLQPLDVGIFSPFKASLSSQCHILSQSQPGRQITRNDLPALIARAYQAAFTPTNLMSAFRKTGVVPFNPSVVKGKGKKETKAGKSNKDGSPKDTSSTCNVE